MANDPHCDRAHLKLRTALKSQGKLNEALTFYTQQLGQLPTNVGLWRGRRDCYLELADYTRALSDSTRIVELEPGNAGALNQTAWLLVTCPDVKLRDPDRAAELARQAIGLAPKDGHCWLTLGWAYYRGGNWKAALESSEKALSLRKGGDCTDWFLLAMIHQRLCEKDKAREWYDRACRLMLERSHQDWPGFRAEAEGVLQIKGK